MPQVTIRVDQSRIARIPPEYRPLLEDALDESAHLLLAKVRKLLNRPYKGVPSRPGQPPRKRTGKLRNAYRWRRAGPGVRVVKARGPSKDVADAMEFGARPAFIRARRRKALLIPVTQSTARAIARRERSARRARGRKRRRGNYLRAAGAIKIGRQVYLLRKWANRGRILPRPHLGPAMESTEKQIIAMLRRAMVQAGSKEMQKLDVSMNRTFGTSNMMSLSFEQIVGAALIGAGITAIGSIVSAISD